MSEEVRALLPTDGDGFLSRQCPYCGDRFMILPDPSSTNTVRFCPYCGHDGQACWWTAEQAGYLRALVRVQVVGALAEQGLVRRRRQGRLPERPRECGDGMRVVHFDCCGERVKCHADRAGLRCPVCGRREDVS